MRSPSETNAAGRSRGDLPDQSMRLVPLENGCGPVFVGSRAGLIEQLIAAIGDEERVLVVGSERARNSGAVPRRAFAGLSVRWFSDFSSNPSLASACRASSLVSEFRPSVVVGLGGGSAMDVAKAARILPPDITVALDMIRSGCPPPPHGRVRLPGMVAVPTLSGSGAEVTRFATFYHDGRKLSLDDAGVLPDMAIIDPSLAATAPHPATSAATLDAICHAVESAWSRSATAESRTHSERALRRLATVRWKADGAYSAEDRNAMAAGAVSAGFAINITRTTAAHAAAYPLTVHHDIPHGVACALNMQWVAGANSHQLLGDPGFIAVVERSLGVEVNDLAEYFGSELSSSGWPIRLRDYGVDRPDLPGIASAATHQARMHNNPVSLTTSDIEDGLASIL